MVRKAKKNLDIPVEDIQPKRMHRLKDRVVVAHITASRFSNSKSDAAKKGEIHADTGADESMFSFSKKLLTKSLLTRVQQHYSRARDLMRVPKANDDGSVRYDPMRFGVAQWDKSVLVPIGRMQDLIVAFQGHKAAMKAEIEALRPEWADQLREAEEASGELFDADLMPSFELFSEAWDMELHITALPEFDPRITLDDLQLGDLVNQVKTATADKLTERLSASWKGAAESMLTSLKYAAAVLADDAKAVMKLNGTKGERKSKRAVPVANTLFDNLNNQVRTARALAEAADDEGLMELADTVAATLGGMTAEHLRKNPSDRQRLAGVAKSLVHKAEQQVVNTKAAVDTAVDELAAFA